MFGSTSKREKTVIIICAILTFVMICFLSVPAVFLFKIIFLEDIHYVDVEYEKMPYALGDKYVYIAPNFFDEQDLQLNGGVSIEYWGRKEQYKDGNFDKPIKNPKGYKFTLTEQLNIDYYKRIDISCFNMFNYSSSAYSNTYGECKYNVRSFPTRYADSEDSDVYENCYKIEYFVAALTGSGKVCRIEIDMIVAEEYADEMTEQEISESKPQKLFESMLDNLVEYSYFK